MTDKQLNALTITEYNLIATKDPTGSYDRRTRENLYAIIEKLFEARSELSPLEFTIFQKFREANFAPLDEKDKRVKFEVVRYLLSDRVRKTAKVSALTLFGLVVGLLAVYHLILNDATRKQVDVAYFAGLKTMGLASKEEISLVESHLQQTEATLLKTKKKELR